jgi:hypothetical protein
MPMKHREYSAVRQKAREQRSSHKRDRIVSGDAAIIFKSVNGLAQEAENNLRDPGRSRSATRAAIAEESKGSKLLFMGKTQRDAGLIRSPVIKSDPIDFQLAGRNNPEIRRVTSHGQ